MSQFLGKRFYFSGAFSFFSSEQRDEALSKHGAFLAGALDSAVDIVVRGADDELPDAKLRGKEVLDEMTFCTEVIFTRNQPGDVSTDEGHAVADPVGPQYAVSIDIERLVKTVRAIKTDEVYSMLAIYPADDGDLPVIRCLFSYRRCKDMVLFACAGLTDNSSDLPLSQYGVLNVAGDIWAAAFESFGRTRIKDQLVIAKADALGGQGFYEAIESPAPLSLPKPALAALTELKCSHRELYTIDDTDEGYYRVEKSLYKRHKASLEQRSVWVQRGFQKDIYVAAESVLSTGRGWSW